ncbi:MAG: hypothetical protein WA717_02770, partial [Methyloceanibacter sp.]
MRKSLQEHAAICSTAEDAAGRILQSACSPTPTRSRPKRRRRRSGRSMTAWGFHDLVGQKVAKITIALDRV